MLGKKVGSYVITGELGSGGMGVVYSAEHQVMHSRAAVKVLRVEHALNDEMAQRFINEATAAATIRHPGIVSVMDVGRMDNGVLYILMEHLDGESLASRIKRLGKLAVDDAVSIVQQAARALEAAHEHNIVHRDLKPDNIFLVPDPEVSGGERVKLLDFGIAKLANDDDRPVAMTKSGAMMGTPLYMSPEQCRGAGEVDHRTDLYALGCILFEMLSGRPPYLGKGVGDLIASHLKDPVPSVLQYNPQVPGEFDNILSMLLAKEPAQRFASAAALNGALQHALSSHPTLDAKPPANVGQADTLPVGSPAFEDTRLSQPALSRGSSTTSPEHVPVLPTTTLGASASQLEAAAQQQQPPRSRRWLLPAVAVVALAGGAVIFAAVGGGGESTTKSTVSANPTQHQQSDAGASTTAKLAPDAAVAKQAIASLKCMTGNGAACMAKSEQTKNDPPRATRLMELACEAKHPPACVKLAERYEGGRAGKPELQRAVDLYSQACNFAGYGACSRARLLYVAAHKRSMSVEKQSALETIACSGAPVHCDGLAVVTLSAAREKDKTARAQAQKIAADLYGRACKAKNMAACVQLGSQYSNGHGVGADKTHAASLYYEACTAGEAHGCLQLAYFYADGRGVPNKDTAKAQELYRKSATIVETKCKRALANYDTRGIRDWTGMANCSTMAYHLDDGVGIKADKPRARVLMKKLCTMGQTESCL